MRVRHFRGGSESGVWEGGLQFSCLPSNPTAASRIPPSSSSSTPLLSEGAELPLSVKSEKCLSCLLSSHPAHLWLGWIQILMFIQSVGEEAASRWVLVCRRGMVQ